MIWIGGRSHSLGHKFKSCRHHHRNPFFGTGFLLPHRTHSEKSYRRGGFARCKNTLHAHSLRSWAWSDYQLAKLFRHWPDNVAGFVGVEFILQAVGAQDDFVTRGNDLSAHHAGSLNAQASIGPIHQFGAHQAD